VRKYRDALSLGGTVSLPEMYRTAGAKLIFNAQEMGELVSLVESELEKLRGGT
jgi:oligoendopeptidase F